MANFELEKYNDTELIELYSDIIKTLKSRKIIRTKNVLGELGEHLAIEYYCKTPTLPNLQAAPIGTQNVDALSRNGDRYSIKSTSTKTTSAFFGLEPQESKNKDKQKFEYLILCAFDGDYSLKAIYQIDWDTFIAHKRWQSRMNAWTLRLSKSLINDAKVIYEA